MAINEKEESTDKEFFVRDADNGEFYFFDSLDEAKKCAELAAKNYNDGDEFDEFGVEGVCFGVVKGMARLVLSEDKKHYEIVFK